MNPVPVPGPKEIVCGFCVVGGGRVGMLGLGVGDGGAAVPVITGPVPGFRVFGFPVNPVPVPGLKVIGCAVVG